MSKGHKDLKASKGYKVTKAILATPDRQGQKEHKGRRASKARKVNKGL